VIPTQSRVQVNPRKFRFSGRGSGFRAFFDGLGASGRVDGSIRAQVRCFALRFHAGFAGFRFLGDPLACRGGFCGEIRMQGKCESTSQVLTARLVAD
jgi:hypothetical protein